MYRVPLFFVLMLSLFVLGIGGVYFWMQLQKVDNTAITQAPVVFKPGSLQEKMMATKGQLTSVATHVGGVDDKYGGFFYQGVYQELVEKKEPLQSKDGKVLGQVTLALRSVYLKPNGTLEPVNVARVLELENGELYEISILPRKLEGIEEIAKIYWGKENTQFSGNVLTNTNSVLLAMKEVGKSEEEVARATAFFSVINEYQESWKVELESFRNNGELGEMKYLLPLFFTSQSFRAENGIFREEGK